MASDSIGEMRTLQAELADRGRSLRFESAMEQAYERDTGAARSRRTFCSNLLGTLVFALLTAIDLPKLSHAAALLEVLRASVLCFCGVGLLWQLLRLQSLRPWERECITAVGVLMMAGYVAVESHMARDVLGVMIGANLIFVFLFTGLVARLEFPFTVAVCLLTLAAYGVGASAYDALTQAILINHFALSACVAALSISGNYVLERRERRAYLMWRLSGLHRDAVQASAQALRQLTLCDPLTGLANRRHFDSEIGKLWRGVESLDAPVGLLQIDVDFFKRYNDRYGHQMGDVCLQRIGEQLSAVATMRGGLAARIGGEEFAVLLPGMDLASANVVAERLCTRVRALAIPHLDSSAEAFVTISVGVASMRPTEANAPAALMLAADLALYRAKREGRNRSAQADPAAVAVDAPQASGSNRPDHDDPGPTAASARVQQLSGLLAAGLYKLRFPPEVESDYWERNNLTRQRRLAMLVFAGMLVTCCYVWLNLPLHADIAGEFMRGTLILCGGLCLPWLATLRRPMPWYVREGLLCATTSALIVGLLLLAAQSRSPGMPSGSLAVSLAVIVSALIAAPPVRFSLPPALAMCLTVGVLTWASAPEDQARKLSAMFILWTTCVYALFGAYLLDLSNRRGYLLRRLGEAQIVELEQINADLERIALTDPLTRLPNRRHFESQLSACWDDSRASGAALALLIIDIDHFKLYNDNYGHLAGDACLQNVGRFIADWCAEQRPLDRQHLAAFAARLGGEEFGVLLPGHDVNSALAVADRLCTALHARRSPHSHSPVSEYLTASIGAASQRHSDSQELRQLLRVADEALYRAKTAGRNRASV